MRVAGGLWKTVAIAALVFAVGGVASALIYDVVYDAPEEEPPAEVETPSVEEAVEEPRPQRRGRRAPTVDDVEEDEEEPSGIEPDPMAPAERPDPEDLLRRANALRGERRWSEAERIYARVMREYPGTGQAYVATVATASLRTEKLGRPAQGLRLYRQALRQRADGYLNEQARHGVADAQRRLGDRQGEIDALRDFLAAHPNSPLRDIARARLDTLTPQN